jgi:hypothetical protein
VDVRERYGEDPVRMGNIGRGLMVVAALLFVAGWIAAIYLGFVQDDDEFASVPTSFRIQQVFSVGSSTSLAAAALGGLGMAMRAVSIWLDRLARETP